MATNTRFVAKNGLDNNGISITNLGATGSSLAFAGGHSVVLTSTGVTTLTLPTSGTLLTTTGNAASATILQTARTLSTTGDATGTSTAFDGSANASIPLTLATVNSNVGSFGSSTVIPVVTVNAKGLVTGVSTVAVSAGWNGGTVNNAVVISSASPQLSVRANNAGDVTNRITGAYNDGFTGSLTIAGGNSTSSYAPTLTIAGGTSNFGNGGTSTFAGGAGAANASGGWAVLQGGDGGSTSGSGGPVYVRGGRSLSGSLAGDAFIVGGDGYNFGSGNGGSVVIQGGSSGGQGGTPGHVRIVTSGLERFRVLENGAISIGSNGTSYGTSGQVLTSNGNAAPTWTTVSAGASVGGANTQIQYNNNGALAGSATFAINTTTNTLTVPGAVTTLSATSPASITLTPGVSTASFPAGVYITGGKSNSAAGPVVIRGGTNDAGGSTGGGVTIQPGNSTNTGGAGTLLIAGGDVVSTFTGVVPDATLRAGDIANSGNTTKAGTLLLRGGNTTNSTGAGGDVTINGGYSAGGPGGSLIFSTAATSTLAERLRITNTGAIAIGGPTAYGTSGQVLTSNGNAAPTWQTVGGAAAADTLTGTTLASNVVNSSLTSVGTLTNLTVTNAIAGSITGNAATVTTIPTLSGDVTSSGNAITLASVGTPGTYRSVTTDAKGRITAGTNPTTLAGYGITDALPTSQKGAANGLATLGADSKIPTSQLPALAITDTFVTASQAAMLALTAETGDVAVRTDLNKSFILRGSTASTLADWQELLTPTDAVLSVNGQTGAITLTSTNIAEGTNLYYTDARARSSISVTGNGSYNSGTGVITVNAASITQPNEQIVYGTGTGISSTSEFRYNPVTGSFRVNSAASAAPSNQSQIYLSTAPWPNSSGDYGIFEMTSSGSTLYGGGQLIDISVGAGFGSNLRLSPGSNTQTNGAAGKVIVNLQNKSGTGAISSFIITSSPSLSNAERFKIDDLGTMYINADAGTSGQVLTSAGVGAPPTWATPAAASVPITTNQVAFGSGTSVTSSSAYTVNSVKNEMENTARRFVVADFEEAIVEAISGNGSRTARLAASNETGGNLSFLGGVGTIRNLTNGGGLSIIAGRSTTAVNGGSIAISAGNSSSGRGGNITLQSDFGPVSDGYIDIMSVGELRMRAGNVVRLTINKTGSWAVGPTATSFGTTGQVLTSNGDTPPTWQTVSATVSQPANQLVFGTGTGVSSSSTFTLNSTTGALNFDPGTLSTGTLTLKSGSSTTGDGADINIRSGDGANGGIGGFINLIGGTAGQGGGGVGGEFYLAGGSGGADGKGGNLTFQGGPGASGQQGGNVSINGGGSSGSFGTGGSLSLTGGSANGTSGFGGDVYIAGGGATSGTPGIIRHAVAGITRLTVNTAGITVNGTITETSTIKVKENVRDLPDALQSVMAMRGVLYDLKDGTAYDQIGFIAEEVQEVLPVMVAHDENGLPSGVHYARMTAVLLEALKTQEKRIQHLEEIIAKMAG